MVSSVMEGSLAGPAPDVAAVRARVRRREISPQAGHALEILGHAIEYLADEHVNEGGSLSASDPRVEAIQLLIALNRQIYFACPQAPTLGERIHGWLHRKPARHARFSS